MLTEFLQVPNHYTASCFGQAEWQNTHKHLNSSKEKTGQSAKKRKKRHIWLVKARDEMRQ